MPEETNLLGKTVRGAQWLFFSRLLVRLLQFARTLVLAVLLLPKDFDLAAVAFIAINFLETFSVTGFDVALIRKKGEVGGYLDTVWTALAARGLLLALLLIALAKPVAWFFDRDAVEYLLYTMSLAFLFRGLTNVGIILFNKEMDFARRFVYIAAGGIVDAATAIVCALIFRSVWALVFGVLAREVVQAILSYVLHPHRPRWSFVPSRFRELSVFGKWILLENVVIYLLLNVDQMFVGKALPPPALGLYAMAYLVSSTLIAEIGGVFSEVLLPAYARLLDDKERLQKAYRDALTMIALIAFPMSGGMLMLAPEITETFLGEKWLAMAPAMMLLCLWGMERGIVATTSPILRAVNRPDISPKMNLIRLVGLCAAIYPFTVLFGWGITGTAAAVLVGALLAAPLNYPIFLNLLGMPARMFTDALLLPIVGTAGMMGAITLVKELVGVGKGAVWLILLIAGGAVVYGVSVFVVDRLKERELATLIARVMKTVKSGREGAA
ncbi:MAG: hypothetical protein A2Z34_07685 [Planctomycetes bacterium RBG_16_59_8]|nr:MAG: hypothetical protein A2Z34_07685 [Planctomycetes bacterium RBG_16_59_8]